MKLYTRTGDDGSTGLFGGQRLGKEDLRVEAYGTADELNSALGLAAAACSFDEISSIINLLQRRLFDLGADLCTPNATEVQQPVRIEPQHVAELEKMIDQISAQLPPLTSFVLPGGTELSARLHQSRAICRRAERRIVALARNEPIGDHVLPFMNRLSDLLFVLARRANQLAEIDDTPWRPTP